MLYERWRETVRAHPREFAIWEMRSGKRWTFADLFREGEKNSVDEGPVRYPFGSGPEFIFAVLKCWRTEGVLCPLDPGQKPLEAAGFPKNWAHIKITSASTGPARLIGVTAEALAADARQIVETMGLRPDWPNLAMISLSHSYGFSNLITPLLLHGIPLILGGDPLPEILRAAGAAFPALTLPGVPALWRAWTEAKALPSTLQLAISAGAPLPLPLEKFIHETYGIKVHNFYGASECGGIAFDAREEVRNDPACAGTPMRGVGLSINESGCLEVTSAAVAEAYWPESSPSLRDGVYHTQDIAEILDGAVYLRGRASDQMNLAGRKVFPQTVENVLNTHPGVVDSLVFSIPTDHGERGEIMVACVVRHACVMEKELAAFLRDRLPAWQVPREWWFVKSLSVDQRGKLSRRQWREQYLAEKSQGWAEVSLDALPESRTLS